MTCFGLTWAENTKYWSRFLSDKNLFFLSISTLNISHILHVILFFFLFLSSGHRSWANKWLFWPHNCICLVVSLMVIQVVVVVVVIVIHKSLPLVTSLNQMNPVCSIPSHFSKINSKIILSTSRSSIRTLHFRLEV